MKIGMLRLLVHFNFESGVKDKIKIENGAASAPEEPGDGDVCPEDPDDADDERHGGDDVGGKGEDDEEQRPEDAHHLRRRPQPKR